MNHAARTLGSYSLEEFSHSSENLSLFKYYLSDVILGSSCRSDHSVGADSLPTLGSWQPWPGAFPAGAPEEGRVLQSREGACCDSHAA